MKTCCCCIELRIGVIIIAVLQVIEALYGFYQVYTFFNQMRAISSDTTKNSYNQLGYPGNPTELGHGRETKEDTGGNNEISFTKILTWAVYAELGLNIFQFLFAAIAIIGILTRTASCLSGWIAFNGFNIICHAILCVIYFYYLGVTQNGVTMVLSVLVSMYYIAVMAELRRTMEMVVVQSGNGLVAFTANVV